MRSYRRLDFNHGRFENHEGLAFNYAVPAPGPTQWR